MADRGNIFTGARARFSVNGKVIGFARGCNSRENVSHEPFRGLGVIEVIENVPVAYDISFSASFARIVKSTLKTLGIQPKVGVSSDELLQNILAQGSITITIEDKITGEVIETIEEARFASRSTSYQAGSISMVDVEFVGIRSRDESGG